LTTDGELQLSAQDERSQHRNREIARERLAALIRDALVVQRRRRATRPTRGSIERRLTAKRVNAEKKRGRKPPTEE
jgi:ribosome-associated protein